jgi:hypothetical protein
MFGKSLASALLALLLLSQGEAVAADKREALYDVALDFNRDGVADRAVLVLEGPGRTDFSELSNERYGLSDDERIDLAIYFGGGSAPPDINKTADVFAPHVLAPERGDWVLVPEATGTGSLRLIHAIGWGSSNESDETLTLAWRAGRAVVAGYTVGWETRNGSGTCDVNLLSGKALLTEGVDEDGPKTALKGSFKPVPLEQWSEAARPKVCDTVM